MIKSVLNYRGFSVWNVSYYRIRGQLWQRCLDGIHHLICQEVKRIFDEAAQMCEKLIEEHRDQLIAVAEYLLENETMDGEEFNYFCDHGELPPPKAAPKMRDETIERPARKISMFIDDDPAAPPTPAQSGEAAEPAEETGPEGEDKPE